MTVGFAQLPLDAVAVYGMLEPLLRHAQEEFEV